MKRFIPILIVGLLLFSTSALARRDAVVTTLRAATNKQAITNYEFQGGTRVTTQAVRITTSAQVGSILVQGARAGAGGTKPDLDVSYELSLDGQNWYEPYQSSDNKSDATIFLALETSRMYLFAQTIGSYIRFHLDPDDDMVATIFYTFQSAD